jgi:hypothetical protein
MVTVDGPFSGVRPKDVAHQASGRRLVEPIDDTQVFNRLHMGRNSTVGTEELLIDDCCEGKLVEDGGADVIQMFRIFPFA